MNRIFTIKAMGIYLFAQLVWAQTTIRPLDPSKPPRETPPVDARRPNPGTPVKPTEPAQPTTPVVPTQPPKKTLDRRQLEQIVNHAVSDYTREILDLVGEAYQVRYNVREGMLIGANRLGNYENESILQNSSEYRNAISQGRLDGQDRGTSAGRSSANSTSYSVASSEINAAIDRTLDTGISIQFKQQPRMVSFSGSTTNLSYPRSIESRWSDNSSSKISQIRGLLRRDPPSQYTSGLFDLASIYRSHVTQVPSDFRDHNAFRTWLENELGTYSNSANEGRKFYKEITNDSLFDQATQNGDLFRTTFERQFDSYSFDRSWNKKVTTSHYGALNLGEAIYLKESSEYASDRGFYKGFSDVFTDASIDAFTKNYIALYKSNFNSIENKVRTTSAITEIQATIVSEDAKSEVTYGDTLNVIVTRIANRGMIAADVSVEISNNAQITPFPNQKTLRVNGLTRMTDTHTFPRLGWISTITAPDQNITITARIHDQAVSFTAKATYEEMIRKSVRTTTADLSLYLMNMALQHMKKQFDDLTGFRDQYRNRDADMLLVRMRKLYDTLTENERSQLRVHGQIIRNVFGGKPNRFLNPKRDEWDASQAMISEMGLPGVVPEYVYPENPNPYLSTN